MQGYISDVNTGKRRVKMGSSRSLNQSDAKHWIEEG
jgi:hypothetical protein